MDLTNIVQHNAATLGADITGSDHGVVSERTFILATRDTGYRDVSAAVAELVDNSLQAGARHIRVFVVDGGGADRRGGSRNLTVAVLDDGSGMSTDVLQRALQFGGTERFNDRTGFGRFGMGLPNSSVSQTRRLDVYTWQAADAVYHTYLDVDEVAAGRLRAIPRPTRALLPSWATEAVCDPSPSGTLVVWARCDRLRHHRAATVVDRIRAALGRIYRYALWRGVRLTVNGSAVSAVDPLLCHPDCSLRGATAYGPPLTYEVTVPASISGVSETSVVTVRFAELPVTEWYDWPSAAKRRAGVVGGAGVSIVRAGREIDHGWYLMGSKRRENYDDWWRCEISFSPALDELFGVTHSKQGVTPRPELRALLEPDLEAVARALNARVRAVFERIKADVRTGAESTATTVATAADRYLPPIGAALDPTRGASTGGAIQAAGVRYAIEVRPIAGPEFFDATLRGGTVVVTVNQDHPFFVHLYGPACADPSGRERHRIECLLLAAARAVVDITDMRERTWSDHMRRGWGDAVAAFLEP